jgi:hypothetical protein
MGRACSANADEEICIWNFRWTIQKKKDNKEDTDVGGRIILKCVFER